MSTSIFHVVRSQDYTAMPTYHLRDKRLNMAAKGLLSVLLADEQGATYTIAELAELGPEGKDAVRSALRRLEECGYITRRQTHDGSGRFAANEYLIYAQPQPLSEKPLTENPTTVAPSSGKPLTENPTTVADAPDLDLNLRISNSSNKASSSSSEKEEDKLNPPTSPPRKAGGPSWKPERFDSFWNFYRKEFRGESKQAAVRAWEKLRPDDALIDTMGRALMRQMKTEEHQRGIGICYASTWLNQRRWEDEIAPERSAARPSTRVEEPPDVIDWHPGMVLP